MNNMDLKGTLAQAGKERNQREESFLQLMQQGALNFNASLNEQVARFSRDMEHAANAHREAMEKAVSKHREELETLRLANVQTEQEMRSRFLKYLIWTALGAMILTGGAAICLLTILPYKALPSMMQAQTEQLTTIQQQQQETRATTKREKEDWERQLAEIQNQLPVKKKELMEWQAVKPLLFWNKDGTLWLKRPQNPEIGALKNPDGSEIQCFKIMSKDQE